MLHLTGFMTFIILTGAVAWYAPLVYRHRLVPAPATWIISLAAMDLSATAYHAIPDRTFIENVTLYAAAFEITIITTFIMIVLWRSGELRVAFDKVQWTCIFIMVMAILYWVTHRDDGGSKVTFWTTQVMMISAYAATISRALQRKEAFDSIGNWGLILLGSIVGSIPAIVMQSPYGMGNSVRAIVLSSITVGLLIFLDKKNSWRRWDDEITTLKSFYRLG